MKLLLASPRGFCAGVSMAIECLEKALAQFPAPIFVFHEIVHNRSVVQRFTARGVIFVDNLESAPEGSTLLFSAHGVSPAIAEGAGRRGIRVIDATCPLVTKVHREARRFAAEGSVIALIGHEGHDEVVGVQGEAPGRIVLLQSESDITKLKASGASGIAYLTQTTLSLDETRGLVQILKAEFPEIKGPPTEDICYATQNRQTALRNILPEAQLALVAGSANSCNTQRLVDLGLQYGVNTKRVDGPEDLVLSWFDGVKTAALTSGASVPESQVSAVIDWLRERMPIELEERSVCEEDKKFPLPAVLRSGTNRPAKTVTHTSLT